MPDTLDWTDSFKFTSQANSHDAWPFDFILKNYVYFIQNIL